MGACGSSFCGHQEETKSELDDHLLTANILASNLEDQNNLKASILAAEISTKTDELEKIVKIQALIRGFLTRKHKKILSVTGPQQSKPFSSLEFKETLSQDAKGTTQTETRSHTYKCSGAVYEGEWLGGFRHGQGTMKWQDGASYVGGWNTGLAQGKGILVYTNGDIYDGYFHNGKPHGKGKYTTDAKAEYVGDWNNGQQHGQGVATWPNGIRYEGSYVCNQKEGQGTYVWADGSSFRGQWRNNKINGLGTYAWSDGREYHGYFKNNNMHDYGCYRYPDGVTYEGQFREDKKDGFGVYRWPDGRCYQGTWHQNRQHGLGTYYDVRKAMKKCGLWENGKRLKWFDALTVAAIEAGNEDVRQWLSKGSYVGVQSFEKPVDFDYLVAEIRQTLNVGM